MLIDFICTFLFHRPHWLCRPLLRFGMKITVHTSCVRKLSLLPRTSPGSYPGNGGPGTKMLEPGSWFPKIFTFPIQTLLDQSRWYHHVAKVAFSTQRSLLRT